MTSSMAPSGSHPDGGEGFETVAAAVREPASEQPQAPPNPQAHLDSGPYDFQPAVPDRSGRVAALDGLRAVAVAAVLLYHAGTGWAQGGFLGVDLFFVLSGYLITGLLAGEYLRTGRISLRMFYLRRARRLLPALFTVIVAVSVVVVMEFPRETATLRGDAAASLGYVTNWYFIAHGQSYFGGMSRPSPLLHLWSLAVEEQFYLVWPLLLIALLRLPGTSGRVGALWRAFGWAAILVAASAMQMIRLYSPWRDPSRVYYGTDTRAFELLIGGVLALMLTAVAAEAKSGAGLPALLEEKLAGVVDAVAGSALAVVVLAVVFFRTTSPTLYPWGLILFCVVSAVLVQAVVVGGAVAGLLASRPMVWVGERSYALYLWHWPVFVMTRPGADVSWPTPVVFAVRIGLSVLLADLSFRFVERPVRTGALGRLVRRCRTAWQQQRPALPLTVGTTALAGLTAAAVLAVAVNASADRHPLAQGGFVADTGAGSSLAAAARQPTPSGGSASSAGPGAPASVPASADAAGLPAPPAKPLRVTIVGDSQGLALALGQPVDLTDYMVITEGTTLGCGFQLARVISSSGGRSDKGVDCAYAVSRWVSRVAQFHPDVAILVTGAWDVYDEQLDGATLKFASPEWDQYYRSRLASTVQQLQGTGVPRLYLALNPCWRPNSAMVPGYSNERGDDWRVKHVNDLLTAFATQAGAGVRLLEPPGEFCTDPKISTDSALRFDGLHYTMAGAAIWYRAIIAQVYADKR